MTEEFTHGTEAGYQRHRRNGNHRQSSECGCKPAHSAYMADRRKQRRAEQPRQLAQQRWHESNHKWTWRMYQHGARADFIAATLCITLDQVETILHGQAPATVIQTPRLVVVVERPTKPPPTYYKKGDPNRCDSPEDISRYRRVKRRNGIIVWVKPEEEEK